MIEYTDSAYHTKTSDEDFAYSLGLPTTNIQWGIAVPNFSQNQLKIKIDTQFCFQ